jgi:hypothetical protein
VPCNRILAVAASFLPFAIYELLLLRASAASLVQTEGSTYAAGRLDLLVARRMPTRNTSQVRSRVLAGCNDDAGQAVLHGGFLGQSPSANSRAASRLVRCSGLRSPMRSTNLVIRMVWSSSVLMTES